MTSETIHIRIPSDLMAKIREQAKRETRTASGQIVHLLKKGINKGSKP